MAIRLKNALDKGVCVSSVVIHEVKHLICLGRCSPESLRECQKTAFANTYLRGWKWELEMLLSKKRVCVCVCVLLHYHEMIHPTFPLITLPVANDTEKNSCCDIHLRSFKSKWRICIAYACP